MPNVFADPSFGADAAAPNPFSNPEFGKKQGAVSYLASQAKAGLTADLPTIAGKALQYAGANDIGSRMRAYGEANAAEAQPDESQGAITKLAAGAIRGAAPIVPLAVGGLAANVLAPQIAVPLELGGAAALAGGFGGAQAQDTMEKGKAAGLSDEQATSAARKTGLITGVGMGAVGALTGGLAAGPLRSIAEPVVKSAAESLAKTAAPTFTRPFLADTAGHLVGNVASMAAANAGTAAVEQQAGLPGPTPGQAALEGLESGAGLTAALLPFGAARTALATRANAAAVARLQNPNTDPQQRADIAARIHANINALDPQAANHFAENVSQSIDLKQPIDLGEHLLKPFEAPTAAKPEATPPEAPDLTTSPGAGVPPAPNAVDFQRNVDTAGLGLVDPQEEARARAARIDFAKPDLTPDLSTTPGAAAPRSGLEFPAPEIDTAGLSLAPSRRMGIDPNAGPISRAAAIAVDSGAHDDAVARAAEAAKATDETPAKTTAPVEQAAAVSREAGGEPERGAVVAQVGDEPASQPLAAVKGANRGAGQGESLPVAGDSAARVEPAADRAKPQDVPAGEVGKAGVQEPVRPPAAEVENKLPIGKPTPHEEAASQHTAKLQDNELDAVHTLADQLPEPNPKSQIPVRSALRQIGFTEPEIKDAFDATKGTAATAENGPRAGGAEQATQGKAQGNADLGKGQAQAKQDGVAPAPRAPDVLDGDKPFRTRQIAQAHLDRANNPPANADGTKVRRTLRGYTVAPLEKGGFALRAPEKATAVPKATGTGPLRIGESALGAELVTVKDGVVHVGKYEALNFESGEPIKVPAGANDSAVKQALTDGGAVPKSHRFFGGEKEAATVTQPKKNVLAEAKAKRDAALVAPQPAPVAEHKDAGQAAEPATAPVVAESLKKAAASEERTPAQMKADLLGEIDKAHAIASKEMDREPGFITFDVPGDGKFKVRNSPEGLAEFRKKVERSPGFSDKTGRPAQPRTNARSNEREGGDYFGVEKGSTDARMAVQNMVEEGDFQAALDYASVKNVGMDGLKLSKEDRAKLDEWLKTNPKTTAETKEAPAAEPKQPAPAEPKKEAKTEPGKVEDFGEKLEGARKDKTYSLDKELSDEVLATEPLSKVWPADEWQSFDNQFSAAVAFAARAEVPAKPRTNYKIARWVEKVKAVRSLARMVTEGKIDRDAMLKAAETHRLDGFFAKVRLLEQLPREQWSRVGSVREYPEAYSYDASGKQTKSPLVHAEIDGKHNSFPVGNVADAMPAIQAKLGVPVEEKKMAFEVRGKPGAYFINKKGDKEYRHLKEFADSKEALAYRDKNYSDLLAAWEAVKDRDNVRETDVRSAENRPRTGEDRRQGKDVTPEQFQDAFGFRGGQFGNWVNHGAGAKERQGMLNQAHDALMDLADIVGIPPKAISLNGSLGIAFGARGHGWASAHFEPNTLVINLTKTRGAGALAHEWFHALDNYFARQRGGEVKFTGDQRAYRESNFITYRPEPMYVHKTQTSRPMTKAQLDSYRQQNPNSGYFKAENWEVDPKHPQGVRPEVARGFAELVDALNASPMAGRSRSIDKAGSEGYWSQIIERGARSFENYVISKMMEKGYHNDYLANVKPVEDFARSKERYPYLLPEEVAPVAEAFDHLFGAIDTKETDKGTALFARGDAEQRPGLSRDQFSTEMSKAFGPKTADRLEKNGVVIPIEDQSSLPAHVVPFVRSGDTVYGFYDPKTDRTYAVLSNLTPELVKGLVIHEVGVHYGFENMLGKQRYAQVINRIKAMGRMGNAEVKTALAEAKKNASAASQIPEETLAYMVHNHPDIGIIRTVISQIKAFLFNKFGIGGGSLNADDITALAKAAVQHSSRTEPGARRPDFAAKESVMADTNRRSFIVGTAAVLASGEGKANAKLGRATALAEKAANAPLSTEIAKVLRGNGATNPSGAKAIKQALQMIAQSGPEQLRALASRIADLMPERGVMLTVEKGDYNAHGAVELSPLPHMRLFDGTVSQGLRYSTFMHESLHVAVLARYRSLSSGVLRSNDKVIGVAEPKAAPALEQFKNLWTEFREATRDLPKGAVSLEEARRTPDEFFVRALTDPELQATLSTLKYQGRTLFERFKDWVKTSLFGFGKSEGTEASWLDAALTASNDLLGSMKGDAADFNRATAIERVNSRTSSAQDESGFADRVSFSRGPAAIDRMSDTLDRIKSGVGNTGAAKNVSTAWDGVLMATAPQYRSDAAREMSRQLIEGMGEKEMRSIKFRTELNAAVRESEKATTLGAKGRDLLEKGLTVQADKAFLKSTPEDNRAFMQAMDTGDAKYFDAHPESKAMAEVIGKMFSEKAAAIQKLGTGALQAIRENYFPHIWKDEPKADAQQQIFSTLAKRPLEGKKAFTKERVFDDVQAGLDAGYEPISNNPLDIVALKMEEMDKYLLAHTVLKNMEGSNGVHLIAAGEKTPKGFTDVNGRFGSIERDGEKLRYVARDDVAQVINNYLSQSLYHNKYVGKPFTAYMGAANTLNQFQLGVFSAFHAGFTSMEAVISHASIGIKALTAGDLKGAAKYLSTAPAAWITNPKLGSKIVEAMTGTAAHPEVAPILEGLQMAGFKWQMDNRFRTDATKNMLQAWSEGRKFKAGLNSIPAMVEQTARPILEWLVPRQKFGVFGEMYSKWMQDNPNATHEELRNSAQQIWNRVDSRLGQVVYDRLFMHNVTKNFAQMLIRAPGWTGGTILEVGGGIKDLAGYAKALASGKRPESISDRAAYTLSMLTITALSNAILTGLFTGSAPDDWRDLVAFRTGNLDEKGRPERFMLPTYMKDVHAYAEAPGHTLVAKAHPLLSLVGDIGKNRDFYGTEIRSEDASLLTQLGQTAGFAAKAFVPFWVKGVQKEREREGSALATVAPLVGVMPAPSDLNKTAAEKLMTKYGADRLPQGSRTQEETDKANLRRQMYVALRKGEQDKAKEAFDQGREQGLFGARDYLKVVRQARKDPLVSGFEHLTFEQAQRVMNVASDDEKRELAPLFMRKRMAYQRQHAGALTPAE